MAKMQRWRRRGPSEDAGTPVEAPTTPADEAVPDDAGVAAEPDTEPDAELDTEPDTEPDTELDAELDAELEEALDAGLDPDHDLDDDLDDPQTQHDQDDFPMLPHVADRSGLTGWLFGGRNPADVLWVQLLQAAHAKQAVTTALAMGLAAAVAGRPAREAGVILLTVLVGQTILGWHNDIVDRERDRAHQLAGKPIATGRLSVENAWYAIIVATLLLVPLATTTGIRAGCLYLAAVAVGMLGNVLLRTGLFSWWSWAVSFALLPAYLSYGGWGGQAEGSAPETAIVVLAALLGVGIHFMRAVWGLVADHEDGWTYLPLRLGLKIGATRLLALSTVFTAVIVVLLLATGARVGLTR